MDRSEQYLAIILLQSTLSASHLDETPGHHKGSETPGATPSSPMWEATPSRATPGHATSATPELLG